MWTCFRKHTTTDMFTSLRIHRRTHRHSNLGGPIQVRVDHHFMGFLTVTFRSKRILAFLTQVFPSESGLALESKGRTEGAFVRA